MPSQTEFIWMNGSFVPWADAKVHFLTHALHYGASAFEGIRLYPTDKGPAVFRLKEHIDRLFYSAGALGMEVPFTWQQVWDATMELLRRTRLCPGYIRPMVYYGSEGQLKVNPAKQSVDVTIACWPWGAYLPHESVDLKVSSFIRIHPKSVISDAKIGGYYVNNIYGILELRGTNYHEALFLDDRGFIAEGPGENIFFVRKGGLVTPRRYSILPGITRSTIMEFAQKLGYSVSEEDITLEQALACDEAFFCGTAAEVTPIRSINDKLIGSRPVGEITAQIKTFYMDMVHGRKPEYEHYLAVVG